jgi:hypothetical protein
MLSAMQYPHWLMVADAVLVCSDLSVLYFARQERTEPDAGAEGEEEMTGQKPVGRRHRGSIYRPLRKPASMNRRVFNKWVGVLQ